MNIKYLKLSEIQVNKSNPRTITDAKFQKLINSLLTLPKMLEYRPLVVDNGVIIGGNMRFRALCAIADMKEDEAIDRLNKANDFKKKKKAQKDTLINYWKKWLDMPIAPVLFADELSTEEKKEFIIKDNGNFGTWDYDALANEWDADELSDWGVDIPLSDPDFNPDSFFEQASSQKANDGNKITLTISIPEDYRGREDEITVLLRSALLDYPGVEVK